MNSINKNHPIGEPGVSLPQLNNIRLRINAMARQAQRAGLLRQAQDKLTGRFTKPIGPPAVAL